MNRELKQQIVQVLNESNIPFSAHDTGIMLYDTTGYAYLFWVLGRANFDIRIFDNLRVTTSIQNGQISYYIY